MLWQYNFYQKGKQNMIKAFADGGARGNPGPASYGVFIENEKGETLAEFGKAIGHATNNVAEYEGVNAILSWLISHRDILKKHNEVQIFLDSLLVVSQMNGVWKVKNLALQKYVVLAKQKQMQLGCKVTYSHIPREKNKRADAMVNKALDEESASL